MYSEVEFDKNFPRILAKNTLDNVISRDASHVKKNHKKTIFVHER